MNKIITELCEVNHHFILLLIMSSFCCRFVEQTHSFWLNIYVKLMNSQDDNGVQPQSDIMLQTLACLARRDLHGFVKLIIIKNNIEIC